jgi:hypothetical protein
MAGAVCVCGQGCPVSEKLGPRVDERADQVNNIRISNVEEVCRLGAAKYT